MSIRKPQPPSNYRSPEPRTLEDLRKLTQYLRDHNDYLADQLATLTSRSGVSSFNGRTGAVVPTSGDYTASLVGLGNVTNDAQLKRSANDFNTFSQKVSVVSGDVVLLEDSAASGTKKYATVGDLANPRSTWTYTGLRNHWTISSALGSAGTAVTTLTDTGTAGKNFTQGTSALAPTVGVDGNGFYYIAGNGTTQYMVTASAADWAMLDGVSPYTVGAVIGIASSGVIPTGLEMICTTTEQGVTTGSAFYASAGGASNTATWNANIGNGTKQGVTFGQIYAGVYVLTLRHSGAMAAWSNPTTGVMSVRQLQLWVAGGMVASSSTTAGTTSDSASGYYATAGRRPLSLFARHLAGSGVPNNGFAKFRLYDLWMTDSYLNDRKLAAWHAYAAATWAADA